MDHASNCDGIDSLDSQSDPGQLVWKGVVLGKRGLGEDCRGGGLHEDLFVLIVDEEAIRVSELNEEGVRRFGGRGVSEACDCYGLDC